MYESSVNQLRALRKDGFSLGTNNEREAFDHQMSKITARLSECLYEKIAAVFEDVFIQYQDFSQSDQFYKKITHKPKTEAQMNLDHLMKLPKD